MRLTFFLVVSLCLHILLIFSVKGLTFDKTERLKSSIVEVKIVPPEPKPEPVEEEIMPEIPETIADQGAAEKGDKQPGVVIPAPSVAIPDIKIPKITGTDLAKVAMPKLNLDNAVTTGTSQTDSALRSELESESSKYHRSDKTAAGSDSSGKTLGNEDANDFFKIKNLGGSRKLVYTPDKPSFSLTSNTNVRVSFKVDREGNTYSILLLNRTDSNIERLAIDFVRKLKFNAVLNADSESAEITLYFRVR